MLVFLFYFVLFLFEERTSKVSHVSGWENDMSLICRKRAVWVIMFNQIICVWGLAYFLCGSSKLGKNVPSSWRLEVDLCVAIFSSTACWLGKTVRRLQSTCHQFSELPLLFSFPPLVWYFLNFHLRLDNFECLITKLTSEANFFCLEFPCYYYIFFPKAWVIKTIILQQESDKSFLGNNASSLEIYIWINKEWIKKLSVRSVHTQ